MKRWLSLLFLILSVASFSIAYAAGEDRRSDNSNLTKEQNSPSIQSDEGVAQHNAKVLLAKGKEEGCDSTH